MTREETRAFLEAFARMRDGATDQLASLAVDAYPTLKCDGTLINAGTRIKWEGKIMKAAVSLYDMEQNTPANAPTLWEELSYKDGYRIIPEVITVTSAFAQNEFGWWHDTLYKSLIANNVSTPEQYPLGWEKQK